MKSLTETGSFLSPAELAAKAAQNQGIFETGGYGLRAGAYGGLSELNTLAGKAMDAFDPGMGAARRAAAAEYKDTAQQASRHLTQLEDVNGLRSAAKWAAGGLGQMAPRAGLAIGAGLATGGAGFVPAALAATASQMPFETGEILQRMDADPVSAQLSPGQQLRTAALPALASAGVQSIVPGMVTGRLLGRGAAQTGKQILGHAALAAPMEGAAEGAGEGLRQYGLNQANPNAGYDTGLIGRNALEGALLGGAMGGVGAVGDATRVYGGALARAPGTAYDAITKAPGAAYDAMARLVPDSVKDRFGEAADLAGKGADATADVAGKAAEWTKKSINERVADIREWGAEFMADPAAPDSFKAQVQDAINNPGDKAKQAWMATQKFSRDAADKAKAGTLDIGTVLRKGWEETKAKGQEYLDRMAEGVDLTDINDPDQAGAQARADETAFQMASRWANEMANENIGPENTAKLKQAATNLRDKANQQIVAGIKRGREAVQDVRRAVDRFANTPAQPGEIIDVEATEVQEDPNYPRLGTTRRSEDYSGARKAISDAVTSVLDSDQLAALMEPVGTGKDRYIPMNRLADALRSYITDMASGKDTFKSDQLMALIEVAGNQTAPLVNAVHNAVRGADKEDTAFLKNLNQIDAIQRGRQSLLGTLRENLRPELRRAVRDNELRTEANMLDKWARKKVTDPGNVERAKFEDNQVRSALETRYGDKADLVMQAVEANIKAERNMIDGENRVNAAEVIGEDPSDPTGREYTAEEDANADVRYYNKGGGLYLRPGLAEDAGEHGSAADQRMKLAKKQNPNAVVHFRTAREIGLDDPRVQAQYAELLKFAEAEYNLKGKDAKAWADKHIDDYGAVSAESSKQETTITRKEAESLRLDSKYLKSKSRIDAGKTEDGKDRVILDAIKITAMMQAKNAKKNYTAFDDKGPAYRAARMFVEGIAAVQDSLGRSFEIPNSTQITYPDPSTGTPGMTWGEAQKLLKETTDKSSQLVKAKDKAGNIIPVPGSAQIDNQVTRLQRQIDAIIKPTAERLIDRLKAVGTLTKASVRAAYAQAREVHGKELQPLEAQIGRLLTSNLGDDTAGRQGADETGFEGTIQRGAVVGKVRMREIEAQLEVLEKKDMPAAQKRAKEEELLQEYGRLSITRNATTDTTPSDLGSGRTQIDPFGPTHDVLGGRGELKATDKGSQTNINQPQRPFAKVVAETGLEVEDVGDPDAVIRTNLEGLPRGETTMGGQSAPATPAKRPTTASYQAPGRALNPFEREEAPITGGQQLGTPAVRAAKDMAKGNAPARMLARKLFALAQDPKVKLSAQDEVVLDAIAEIPKISDRAAPINMLYDKHKPMLPELDDVMDFDESMMPEEEAAPPRKKGPAPGKFSEPKDAWVAKTIGLGVSNFKAAVDKFDLQRLESVAEYMRGRTEPPRGIPTKEWEQAKAFVNRRVDEESAAGGAPPSPKVRAAKEAALLKAATSSDPALLKELRTTDDAKGLQRAIDTLSGVYPKDTRGIPQSGVYPKTVEGGVQRALDAANARMSELVQNSDTAYGLTTTKYSLMSTQIHEELGRSGFPATHDSPIRHEGKFDWRSHAMKGEGGMALGAGTYLSTAEGVHKFYKKQFTATVQFNAEETKQKYQTAKRNVDLYTGMVKDSEATLIDIREQDKAWSKVEGESDFAKRLREHNKAEGERESEFAKMLVKNIADMKKTIADAQRYMAENPQGTHTGPAPTYEVSVDIKPEQLMNWNKRVDEQSQQVQRAMEQAAKAHGIDLANNYAEDFYRELSEAFDKDRAVGDRKASDLLQSLGILGHRMNANIQSGDQNPNYVIYDDSKINTNYVRFDKTRTAPGAQGPLPPGADAKAVLEYLARVHGNSISVAWANIMHAGEFRRTAAGDVIRISIHSLNPMSTAYHESLHGFMAKLRDMGMSEAADVLEKAGTTAPIMNQLKTLLANEPDALKQLNDAEERAAYMYQFWAMGKLNVGAKVESIFQRLARFFREVTGLMSNTDRAVKMLEYFHSGQFEANRSNPSAVAAALEPTTTLRAVKQFGRLMKPLGEFADSLMSAGGARLRDSGVPALRDLAEAMKLQTISEGTDPGFLPAARAERTRLMNQMGVDLQPYSEATINEALEAMQTGKPAPSVAGRTVAAIVNRRLQEMLKYMQDAGVEVSALGMKDGVPYFPRSWDAAYISSNQRAFLAMMEKYENSGELERGSGKRIMEKLMVTDGAEFNIETDRPGMQHVKERVLKMISHEDAAPFMHKNLVRVMNSYVTQATRRAEWARRFQGHDENGNYNESQGVRDLMDAARKQGATPQQMEMAQDFVQSVDGTLGDTINPEYRRLMGNMIVYQNIRLLPMAIFSSIVDPMGTAVRGGTMKEAFGTFMRGMKDTIKNFQKNPTEDWAAGLAEAIGTVDSSILMYETGAAYSQGMVGDTARKINDTFFRWNLMERWNRSMRIGATETALNFIARHAKGVDAHSVRYLRELGLSASDVQMSPVGRIKVLPSDGLTMEQSAKMKAAVNRWVDGAVLRPDAVDKAIWMNDPHFALIAHLKSFVFSFHETILKRIGHELKHGNVSPAVSLIGYVPIMIAADAIKGLIQGGGDEPEWKKAWGPSDYIWSGMERAGLFGVGQFGLDVAHDLGRGGIGVGALTGPTIDQFVDAVQVLGGREQFGTQVIRALPANAVYGAALKGDGESEGPVERNATKAM